MELLEGAEPYELFEFGDSLHVFNDESNDRLYVWVGIIDSDGLDGPEARVVRRYSDHDVMGGAIGERVQGSWMPVSKPYWHRASHCPLKEEA